MVFYQLWKANDAARLVEMVDLSGRADARPKLTVSEFRNSTSHLGTDRRRSLFPCRPTFVVSVRASHSSLGGVWRGISGSFVHWRISGGIETFREQGAPRMVVDPHRGVATERLVAAPLLSTSSSDRDDVLALAESTGGRESLARQDWGVILTLGYAFTLDGGRKAISRERTNSLSTRRAARDFNPTVLLDVSFWVAVLSGEAEGLFALEHEPSNDLARFAPTIVLSHRTPTIVQRFGL